MASFLVRIEVEIIHDIKWLYLSLQIWLSNFGSQVLAFLVNQNAKIGEPKPESQIRREVSSFGVSGFGIFDQPIIAEIGEPKSESQNLRAKIGEKSPVLASQVLAQKMPKPESQNWRAKIGD